MKGLEKAVKEVVLWNQKAGVRNEEYGTYEWWKSIELQSKLLVEESTECYDSALVCDPTEVLDGVVDNFVIASKLMEMLESAGFDVMGAIAAVQENNNTKIFSSYTEAAQVVDEYTERGVEGCYVQSSVVNGVDYFTVRRKDGKIMKRTNHERVDLSKFVPEGK